MKRFASRFIGLAFLLMPLGAVATAETLSVEDILRLHDAGVSEEVILSEIMVTESVFDLSVEEILRLNEAGLSDRLIKFMIDTGQSVAADDSAPIGEEYRYDDPDEGDATYYPEDDTWVNVIAEEPAVTYVTLDYSYPTWWYDNYWYDYWYWGFTYYPYRSSWCWSVNTWYPAWYSWGSCYPYYPYRHQWRAYAYYGGCGYSPFVDYAYRWDWDRGHDWHTGGHGHGLSDVKYKAGDRPFSQPLYPDRGLKLPVPTVTTKDKGTMVADTRGGGKVRLRDKTIGSSGHDGGGRPVKGVAVDPGRSLPSKPVVGLANEKAPVKKKVVRPARDVRSPAHGDRPVKIVRPPKRTDVRTKDHGAAPASRPRVEDKTKDRPTAPPKVDAPPRTKPRPKPAPSSPPKSDPPKVKAQEKSSEQVRPPAPPKPKEKASAVKPGRSGDSRPRVSPPRSRPRTAPPKTRPNPPRSGGRQSQGGKSRGR